MAVPKQKHTKSRRNKRRMHLFLTSPSLGKCQKCGKSVKSHTVCFNCGYYKGVEIVDTLKKMTKKEQKQKEKEMKAQESEEKKDKPVTLEGLSRK